MTIEETARVIRTMITATIIAEYQLTKLVDGTKQDLKMKVKCAINQCRNVQNYFITHSSTTEENRKVFKEQFLGDEIVLLTELLETCYGIKEEGIELILSAVKQALIPIEK